uniref:Extracellular calcium-sensing receptor-like n=1 Tax=Gouania willdenowi TaxID=441366 RepID=A0A8C5HNU0_GOUWI
MIIMGWITLIFFTLLAQIRSENQSCTLIGQTGFMEFSKEGDLMIGGVFSISSTRKLNDRELKFARTMIFTVEEINRDASLLPGLTLGYRLFNGCGSENLLRATVEAMNGKDSDGCNKKLLALIGHSSSGVSNDMNYMLSLFSFPQVSHLSTCSCLSENRLYPTFFRTVPSDRFQIHGLVQLMKYFDWRWVGVIYSIGLYSESGTAEFVKEASKEGICVEYVLPFRKTSSKSLELIVETLKVSTSKVVLLFSSLFYTKSLLQKLEPHNITGKQWIGSESWITQSEMASDQRKSILQGAIGFALPRTSIAGLGDFLLSLKPSDEPNSTMVKAIWEEFFDCSFSPTNTSTMCTGAEDLQTVSAAYTDVTFFREENYVYKAVYSLAHALHSLLKCYNGSNPATGKPCVKKHEVQPKLVLEHLKLVNFTTKNGAKVAFDENGDSGAQYDLVNWQIKEDGSVTVVNIGHYDNSLSKEEQFRFKKDTNIVWGGNMNQVPRSVCREPCPPGTRKAINKNRPICCFDCFECPEGTISNQTNAPECLMCPPELWPNEKRDACIPKPIEYLSYEEIMGAILAAVCIVCVFFALLISIIFITHKETPIVRANNSELSFLLLFSLKLCFLCSLTFIGRPTEWSCMLRHTAFGITFVLCISCVLGKTILVLIAFKSTLPGNNASKRFGPIQQRICVLTFTLIQILICILWLTLNPPFPYKNMKHYKEKIILECALGSPVGFWAVLGYIAILAILCFILAFLARKLPDSFNEAKLITFSMLIFCAVWMTFVPAYVSSPGKFTVAVEIFAILSSSFGLLVCIFVPKCYIIIFRPEQNSKKFMMARKQTKTF